MEKKLIYIDSDRKDIAADDVDHVKRILDDFLPEKMVNKLKMIAEFHWMAEDKAAKILFDPKNVIITWSMYTWNHLNSQGKFINFVALAGLTNKKDLIYFDGSGNLKKDMDQIVRAISETSELLDFLTGVSNNHIITHDYEKAYRISLDFSKGKYNATTLTEIDFKSLVMPPKPTNHAN